MATGQPGPSPSFPSGQARQAFGRDWGNYTTVATMPNGSGNILTAGQFKLEAGDHCYLSLSTGQCDYMCISAGTAAGGDAVWVPSSGQGPWSSVLYVDGTRGSDTTGQRGNESRPFLTIQAANNAMSNGDIVMIAMQNFSISAALTIPATVVNYGIISALQKDNGTGGPGARITSSANDTFSLGANLGLSRFTISNIALSNLNAGKACILADFSTYALNAGASLLVDSCNITGDIITLYANAVVIAGQASGGSLAAWTFTDGGNVTFRNSYDASGVTLTLAYDLSHALCRTTQTLLSIGLGAKGGAITMTGQSRISVDALSQIASLAGSGLNTNAAPARVPSISCLGVVTGTINFRTAGTELPDTATALTVQFIGGLLQSSSFAFKVGGAAANFQSVSMNGVHTIVAATFIADVKIHLTLRGAMLVVPTLSTPGADGDIVPPSPLVIAPVAVAANPQTITYPCRIAAGSVAVSAYVASDNASAVPTQVITAAGQASFAAGLNALPFDVPQFSGIVTGGAGATTAYAGNNPLAATLVPVNYPAGRASRFGVLKVYVTANALVSATTFTLYKNNVATAVTLSVGAAATGIFSDVTHTADFAVDDRYDLRMDNTAGGVAALVFAATIEQFINPIAGNLRATVMFP